MRDGAYPEKGALTEIPQMRNHSPLLALALLLAILEAPLATHAVGENKLEVFSWWTSGGEAAALDALFNVYKKQSPGVEIVNATVGRWRLHGSANPSRLGIAWPVRRTRLLRTDYRAVQK